LTTGYPVSYNNIITSIVMKNLSTMVKRAFLIAGLMIVAILVYTPAGAGENGITFHINGSDAPSSAGIGLTFPLTRSLSLDFGLSSVNTGQVPPVEKQLYAPPIPLPKEPGSDLRYSRVGVGLSFGF
jgi:hypothetical protein